MSESAPRPCRKCRRPIIFAPGPNGTPIPLSAVRTVYVVLDGVARTVKDLAPNLPALYISHFVDCPSASSFGKGKRPEPDPENQS